MNEKIDIAILGADRYIGQCLLSLLDEHPYFSVRQVLAVNSELAGSSAAQDSWLWEGWRPDFLAGLTFDALGAPLRARFCLSVLPDGAAAYWERYYAETGAKVLTHAEDLRLADDVPLLLPELVLTGTGADRTLEAGLVATPNCTTTILALVLAALDSAFEIEAVHVTALQAISGGDFNGIDALSLADNLQPGLEGEETALRAETERIFEGRFQVAANAVRVPVHTGHCLLAGLRFSSDAPLEEVRATLSSYRAPDAVVEAPNGIERPIRLANDVKNHPAPRPDGLRARGMTVTVGGLRQCAFSGTAMTIVANNMIRGSAGNLLLLAELFALYQS